MTKKLDKNQKKIELICVLFYKPIKPHVKNWWSMNGSLKVSSVYTDVSEKPLKEAKQKKWKNKN